jgi:hypothetical protein
LLPPPLPLVVAKGRVPFEVMLRASLPTMF